MKYYLRTDDSFFGALEANVDGLLESCIAEMEGLLQVNPPIVVYGKPAIQRRSVGFFSDSCRDGYHFAGQVAAAEPLTHSMHTLLELVNAAFHADFNGVLVNHYKDGNDYIGKHSDDVSALCPRSGIAMVSYGAPRMFRVRSKTTNDIVLDIPTTSTECWIMGGDFQREFTHEVPVQKKVKECRYSFTFRKHL